MPKANKPRVTIRCSCGFVVTATTEKSADASYSEHRAYTDAKPHAEH